LKRLKDKVAIITGVASGIGKVAASLFAEAGAKLVCTDISDEKGRETVEVIGGSGGEATFVQADISNPQDVQQLVRAAIETYGRLDILYNNAGIAGSSGSTVECSEQNWEKTIAVDLKAVWLTMKYAIPEMLKSGGGAIVNTGSQAAMRGMTNLPAYAAAKGGVVSLTRATAMEFAKSDIRVNCLNPGIITTPMALGSEVDPHDYANTDEYKRLVFAVPQGRLGKPEDVALAALFLASDEASHITGQVIGVDGGMEADSHTVREDEFLNK
jgi:NAD(P)-dependent dehydrogenase (short-subunit alcohol dehydrogenase family)